MTVTEKYFLVEEVIEGGGLHEDLIPTYKIFRFVTSDGCLKWRFIHGQKDDNWTRTLERQFVTSPFVNQPKEIWCLDDPTEILTEEEIENIDDFVL